MNQKRATRLVAGLALGIGLGAALSNVALGIALGIAFGAAFSRIDADMDLPMFWHWKKSTGPRRETIKYWSKYTRRQPTHPTGIAWKARFPCFAKCSEHLFQQLLHDKAMAAGEDINEAGNVIPIAHGQCCHLQPCNPSFRTGF